MDTGVSQSSYSVRDTPLGLNGWVSRLMKDANLSVAVKRICQTTTPVEGGHPYVNRLETLEISRPDQVWVGDITYVRLKKRFIYVRCAHGHLHPNDQRMAGQSAFEYISDVETATRGTLGKQVSGDTSFRSRCAVSFNRLSLDAPRTRY